MMPSYSHSWMALPLLLCGFIAACGQDTGPQQREPFFKNSDSKRVKSSLLKPGIGLITGSGGNVIVAFGKDATILVDDEFAAVLDDVNAAARELGAGKVDYVINTHWHIDHIGGNAGLREAGALIVAHENVRKFLRRPELVRQRLDRPLPKNALPVMTFSSGASFFLNGEEIRMTFVPKAHSNSDTLVYWSKSNVLHAGDVFVNYNSYPYIDQSTGGTITGLIAAVDKALEITNDETIIVPGHGTPARREALKEYRIMLDTVMQTVVQARKQGKSLAQIIALRPAHPWGEKPQGFINADKFVEQVYNNLIWMEQQEKAGANKPAQASASGAP